MCFGLAHVFRPAPDASSRSSAFFPVPGRWNFHKLLVGADGALAGVSGNVLCTKMPQDLFSNLGTLFHLSNETWSVPIG